MCGTEDENSDDDYFFVLIMTIMKLIMYDDCGTEYEFNDDDYDDNTVWC